MKIKSKIAILAMSMLVIMSTAAMSPALPVIAKAFPNLSASTIAMVVTLPSLVTIPFSLLAGRLAVSLSKRKLALFGIAIYSIGGVSAGFFDNFYLVLAMRGLLGAGAGFIITLSSDLIADFFDGNEMTSMIGLQNAFYNVGAIGGTLVCGYLSVVNWKYSFSIYAIAFVVLVITYFLLPETTSAKEGSNNEKTAIAGKVYITGFFMLLLYVGVFSIFTRLPFFISSENLGNAASAGVSITGFTVAGLISGLAFGVLTKALNKFVSVVALTLAAVGFYTLSISTTLNTVTLSVVIAGLGIGIMTPFMVNKMVSVAIETASTVTLSISILFSLMFVGQFLSPFIYPALGTVMGNDSARFSFLFNAIFFLGAAILNFFMVARSKKVSESTVNQ